jgi:hypothetical protein
MEHCHEQPDKPEHNIAHRQYNQNNKAVCSQRSRSAGCTLKQSYGLLTEKFEYKRFERSVVPLECGE